jgi:hypothetical protein
MLKEEYFGKLTTKQYNSIDIVLRNTERLDKIIMDLLEVSRIEAARLRFNFVKTNLTEHIRRLFDEMSLFMVEKNIQLVPNLEHLPEIECDPDRVMQILRNLLENSMKFSKKNNRIIVTVKKVGSFIQISVKDFGIGISEESKKRMFEPFFQGEKTIYRKYGGTGLGLAICKGIAESQGGRIWFDSKLGEGTEFFYTIPLIPVKEQKPMQLLTSSTKDREEKILGILREYIGPMAKNEMKNLKLKGLTEKRLLNYAKLLKDKKILDEGRTSELKQRLKVHYNPTKTLENQELIKLMGVSKRKDFEERIQKIISVAYNLYGEVAIRKANNVFDLQVDYNGKVISLTKGKEADVLRALGRNYIDLMGDLTKFIETREVLNNKPHIVGNKR